MEIIWLGHSCFLLQSEAGTRLLMDPPDPETGYDIRPMEVDAVTSSHNHHDHACFSLAPGAPRITEPGRHTVKDMKIEGFPSWHDGEKGAVRGPNILYRVEVDGLRILHAGDLGEIPAPATCAEIGHVDVLMVPVGGVYTIGPEQALELSNLLKPKIVIPMHYKTASSKIMLGDLMPFLNASRNCAIHRMREPALTVSPDSLGEDRIVVLEYAKPPKEE